MSTWWGQGSDGPSYAEGAWTFAYNNYIKHYYNNTSFKTGCVPTAMAQIIAYHGYIAPNAPYKPSNFNSSSLGTWTGAYDFSLLRNYPMIYNTASAAVKGQAAALMYQVGKNVNAKYLSGKTVVENTNDIKRGFEAFGYRIDYQNYGTDLTETTNSSKITYYTSPTVIKNALDNKRPVLMIGTTDPAKTNAEKIGHAWVIDGYGAMTYYREYFTNRYNQTTYVTITLNNCLMVHCNLGWNDLYNGWYVYGIFDTKNRTIFENSNQSGGEGEFSKNTYMFIPRKP